MTQPGNETPGIGGVPGLAHRSGPAFKAFPRFWRTVGVHVPLELRKAQATRRALVAMSRRRK